MSTNFNLTLEAVSINDLRSIIFEFIIELKIIVINFFFNTYVFIIYYVTLSRNRGQREDLTCRCKRRKGRSEEFAHPSVFSPSIPAPRSNVLLHN